MQGALRLQLNAANSANVPAIDAPAADEGDFSMVEECNLLSGLRADHADLQPSGGVVSNSRGAVGHEDMVFFRVVDRAISKTHTFQGSSVSLLDYDCVISELGLSADDDEGCVSKDGVFRLQSSGLPQLCLLWQACTAAVTEPPQPQLTSLWVCETCGTSLPCIEISTEKQDYMPFILARLPTFRQQGNPHPEELLQLEHAQLFGILKERGWTWVVGRKPACVKKDDFDVAKHSCVIHDGNSLPSVACLSCCILLPHLFQAGLQLFHFFQVNQYYLCLLQALQLALAGSEDQAKKIMSGIQPNITAKRYKQLQASSTAPSDAHNRRASERGTHSWVQHQSALEIEDGCAGARAAFVICELFNCSS